MPNLAWEKNIETTKKYCKCGSKIGSSLVVRTNSHSNQEASVLRVWLLVVKCCSPWSRLTLHPLSSNNVDFWNYLWEPTIEKKVVSCAASEPNPSNKEIKERLIKEDTAHCRTAALEHASLRHFNHICQNRCWMALWEAALEHGTKGTSQTLALLRAFSQPIFGDLRCPLQHLEGKENCIVSPDVAVLEHFHIEHNITNTESVVTSVENRHSSLFSYAW